MAGLPTVLHKNYPDGTQTPTIDIMGIPFPDPTTAYGWGYDGYKFSHWAPNADGTGLIKQIGDDTDMGGGSYYAIWVVVDVNYLTNTSELMAIANAIREKGETTAQLSYPAGFVSAISNISTGITPSGTISITSNGTYNVTNYASASVNVSGGSGYTIDDIAERNMMSGSIYGGSASYIGSYAFYSCNNLTKVSFPMATSIGGYAFSGCWSLTEANFPLAAIISGAAFMGCSKLNTVSFPMATSIGIYAFQSCINLTTANFPLATIISNYAFSGCSKLNTVSFPVATSIGANMFRNCFKLLSLYLNNVSMIPTLGNNAFLSTPIGGYTASTGGVYGSVFVPANLYSSFLTAKNWSSISARIVSV